MGLEAATYIHQLNPLNPVGAVDPKAQGDDHLRMIKSTLQATFPNIAGAMTVNHTNLNQWGGLSASYSWTGAHTFSQAIQVNGDHVGVANTDVYYELKETDAAADSKIWWWRHTGGLMSFQTRKDDLSAGAQALNFVRSGFTFTQLQLGIDGVVGTPGYSFANDPDTGLYRPSANVMAVAVGGQAGPLFQQNGGVGQLAAQDGLVGFPGIAFSSDGDTGVYRVGADQLGITAGGARVIHVVAAAISGMTVRFDSGQIGTQDGTIGAPSYSFVNDPDTGFYRVGANEIGIVSGGAVAVDITNSRVLFPDGVVGTPGLTFNSDPDTGMYRAGSNNLRFGTGGVKALEIDSNQDLYYKNNFRLGYLHVPRSTTITTFALSDVGKCVAVSAAINIPASVFSAGDCITVYNDSAAAVNITISAGTLRLAGSTTTGTRTLQSRGLATLWFNVGGATPEVIASGSGLS